MMKPKSEIRELIETLLGGMAVVLLALVGVGTILEVLK